MHNPLRLPHRTTSERQKVVRTCCFFNMLTSKCASRRNGVQCALSILTSKCASRHNGVHFFDISTSKSGPNVRCFSFFTCKCASRHNGVQFFISHLASWLRTRCFSEPTFRPSGATNHRKTRCFVTFLPFRAPGSSFF